MPTIQNGKGRPRERKEAGSPVLSSPHPRHPSVLQPSSRASQLSWLIRPLTWPLPVAFTLFTVFQSNSHQGVNNCALLTPGVFSPPPHLSGKAILDFRLRKLIRGEFETKSQCGWYDRQGSGLCEVLFALQPGPGTKEQCRVRSLLSCVGHRHL